MINNIAGKKQRGGRSITAISHHQLNSTDMARWPIYINKPKGLEVLNVEILSPSLMPCQSNNLKLKEEYK